MKVLTPPGIAERVDIKSHELIAEFRSYRDQIIAENPDDPQLADERAIFESWALQKIAGLQCVIEDLVKAMHGKKGKKARR